MKYDFHSRWTNTASINAIARVAIELFLFEKDQQQEIKMQMHTS